MKNSPLIKILLLISSEKLLDGGRTCLAVGFHVHAHAPASPRAFFRNQPLQHHSPFAIKHAQHAVLAPLRPISHPPLSPVLRCALIQHPLPSPSHRRPHLLRPLLFCCLPQDLHLPLTHHTLSLPRLPPHTGHLRTSYFLSITAAFPFLISCSQIHKLTPYDVGTIAAMGDSITAAFAACAHCIVEIIEECRGASWSIGGVDDFSSSVTLPNIIKQ